MPAFNYNYSPTSGSGSFNVPSFQDILGASPQDFISYLTGQKLQLQQPLIDLQRSQLGEQGRQFDVTNQYQNRALDLSTAYQNRALAQRLAELQIPAEAQRYISDAPTREYVTQQRMIHNLDPMDFYRRTPYFLNPMNNSIA